MMRLFSDQKSYRIIFLVVWILWNVSIVYVPCLCPQTVCTTTDTPSVTRAPQKQTCCSEAKSFEQEENESSFAQTHTKTHFCEHSHLILGKGITPKSDNENHFQIVQSVTSIVINCSEFENDRIAVLALPSNLLTPPIFPSFWGRTLPLLS
ncbi:MAG: hypothetical protein N2450_05695 [bacterium]|nr:hypothetical protein [bacterium]